jgi:hypothetical protein
MLQATSAKAINALLNMSNIRVEKAKMVQRGVASSGVLQDGLDDRGIAACGVDGGCEYTFPLDNTAANLPGMRLLECQR